VFSIKSAAIYNPPEYGNFEYYMCIFALHPGISIAKAWQIHLSVKIFNYTIEDMSIQRTIQREREREREREIVSILTYNARRSAEIAAQAEAEARSSARQLVGLQQRLATLKDSVAAAQRLAAARETAAAAAIQRNASDTAAELRKQDVDNQVTQSEREAKVCMAR
jgi:hypothetical protein